MTKELESDANDEIETFAESLFDDPLMPDRDWPDDFDEMDAVGLVKAIAKTYKKLKKKSKGRTRKIVAVLSADDQLIDNLLDKYSDARPTITGEVLDTAFEALELCFSTAAPDDESYCPKVLVNGGLMLRHERSVYGAASRPSEVVRVQKDVLRAQLADFAAAHSAVKDAPTFFILHRDEAADSKLIRTRNVPAKLNGKGQTLVFLESGIDLSSIPCLANTKIQSVVNQSNEFALIQVYSDMAFVYRMDRSLSLGEFEEDAVMVMNEWDDPIQMRVEDKDDAQLGQMIEVTMSLAKETGFTYLKDTGVIGWYARQALVARASERLDQLRSISQTFTPRGDRPVRAFDNQPDYSLVSRARDDRAVILEFTQSAFKSIDEFEKNFAAWFGTEANDRFGANLLAVELLTVEPEDFELADQATQLVSLTSKVAGEYLKETARPLRTEIQEAIRQGNEYQGRTLATDELEEAVFDSADFSITVVLSFRELPFPAQLDEFGCSFSAKRETLLQVVVPALGLEESYDDGAKDEGNADKFIPRDDSDDSSEEDEDEDDEDDEDDE
jgi:hypothetical protein